MSEDPTGVATQTDPAATDPNASSGSAAGSGEGDAAQSTSKPDPKAQQEAFAKYIGAAISKAVSPFNERFATIERALSESKRPSGGDGQAQASTKLAALAEAIGLDANQHGLLKDAVSELLGDHTGRLEQVQGDLKREQFYSTYPDLREMRPQIDKVIKQIESGDMSVDMLVAAAVRGVHAQKSIDEAKKNAVEEFKQKELPKILAKRGAGTGTKPADTPEAKEVRDKEIKETFNVTDAKVTHKPEDA